MQGILNGAGRSSHSFARVPTVTAPRSQFDRSFTIKTTFNSGYLTPFYCEHVLPGDTFNAKATIFARLATPIVPVLDNMYLDTFYFFVPYRLVWSNFVRMMGEQDNPADSTSYIFPTIDFKATTGFWPNSESIFDYFGLPVAPNALGTTPVTTSYKVMSLPFRAYNLIWNRWFRDQNLQNSVTVRLTDTGDLPGDFTLLYRGRRHDYFSSALPWPQKGTASSISVGGVVAVTGSAEVWGTSAALASATSNAAPILQTYNTTARTGKMTSINTSEMGNVSHGGAGTSDTAFANRATSIANNASATAPLAIDTTANNTLQVNLASATAITINAFRQAVTMQQLLELNARGGTRYQELMLNHFQVYGPDARLQYPEYIGGGSERISVTPIAQSSGTGASGTTSPQGNLAAIGVANVRGSGFVQSFVEHGVIIGLLMVRTDQTYQYGLDRHWSKSSPYDLYWPVFANLGEQAVLNQEIYFQGNGATADTLAFGYQEYAAEYRYKPSFITGQMRSSFATPLDLWHFGLKFASLPTLGSAFIQDTPQLQRTLAVQSPYPEFKADISVRNIAARRMPMYSVPGLSRL